MGVFHPDLVGIQVRVLQRLGAGNALVVWGRDGMDEISLAGPTLVGELRDGSVSEYEIEPEQFGFTAVDSAVLRVENPEQSKARVLEALENRAGAARDIVALNAGAALYASGRVDSIAAGIDAAKAALESGAARAKLNQFVAATRRLKETE
jgi:anthranilate phosphoribosyltransferase